jgi:hypothetical protein
MISRLNRCDPDLLRQLTEGCLPEAKVTELEEHLHACSQCQAALDRLAGADHWVTAARRYLSEDSVSGAEVIPPAGNPLGFLAPSDWPDSLGRLGTYEVKGALGRGGMSTVLKAIDPALNRAVAIKVLAAHLANSGAARQRFLREARAAAAVVHEHVVGVHAVDEVGGLPYLVMDYVPGRSLQDRLDRQGPLSVPEILRIGMQAAAGLAAAHAQGIVHRDVKPANILLQNGLERVRLTDFGLARAVADAAITQSGVVSGTPHYMAPEQARGESVDHRADLFSLGSTLYALCTGHPPFRAESAVAVLRRVSDDEPRSIRELNPDVPEWLAAIISRLQAKDPARRFQTAAEVAALLGACLAHVQQPLAVPLPAGLEMTARGCERGRRFVWALPAVLAGFLAVAGTLALKPWQQPGSEADGRPVAPPAGGTLRSRSKAGSADEIDDKIRAARKQAGAVEADLCRREIGPEDSLSTCIHDLVELAKHLQQEIASGVDAGRPAGR